MVTGAALRAKLKSLKARKELPILDRRFRQDPATATVVFTKMFGWAAEVFGMKAPLLYLRGDVPGLLVFAPNEPPASVAGRTVLSGFTLQELAFLIGEHLAMYRGEH